MSKKSIFWIISASLMIVGALIFVLTMTALGWNFAALEPEKFEAVTYEINEDFDDIRISVDTSDVRILPSEDGRASAISYESERIKHELSVKDGVLTVSASDEGSWIHGIGFNFDSPRIILYLPEEAYGKLTVNGHTGDVEIASGFTFSSIDATLTTASLSCLSDAESISLQASTGDLHLFGVAAESVSLKVTTGDVSASNVSVTRDLVVSVSTGDARLTDVECGSFLSSGSTGDIALTRLLCSGKLVCERSTGDVLFDHSDAAEISVTTTTGDVTGTLLSTKYFIVKLSTGSKRVPESTEGGFCEITVSTGNVFIDIAE